MQIAEPRLPDDLEGNADDGDDRCWHADALRALAEQLSVTNDFYFPLLSAATLLDGRNLSQEVTQMTSFQLSVSPNRRAAGRFVFSVRRELQKALVESGISQSHVARAIGVHRSVISRELNGRSDMTLGRVAEIANVLGRVPTFSLPDASQGASFSSEAFAGTRPRSVSS